MKFDQALHELQNETVADGALELTLSKALQPQPKHSHRNTRRGLVFATGVVAIALFALYPWRKSDRLWAQAKTALIDAPFVHIRLEGVTMQGPGEIWIHGDKVRETTGLNDFSRNDKFITQRVGQVSSTKPIVRHYAMNFPGYSRFQAAIGRIKSGQASRGTQTIKGKPVTTYRFNSGGVGFGDSSGASSGTVADIYLTAFVDDATQRIIKFEEHAVPNKNFDEYKKTHAFTLGDNWTDEHRMVAWIDYPASIDDTQFDPPADAFDQTKAKEVMTSFLQNKYAEKTVVNQKVTLHGILFDGRHLNVIWSGCPANYATEDRFRIEGVILGQPADIRCLSSGKYSKEESSKVLYCQLGSQVLSQVPNKVTITMPVFAPDKTRPSGKAGFLSRKVGEVTFRDVPVTRTLWIEMFERQFGLLNHWW